MLELSECAAQSILPARLINSNWPETDSVAVLNLGMVAYPF